jgi:hypothetical protein
MFRAFKAMFGMMMPNKYDWHYFGGLNVNDTHWSVSK